MIGVIGISHRSATLSIREKYSLSSDDIGQFIKTCTGNSRKVNFVALSTCNRTEIYFDLPNHTAEEVTYQTISEYFNPYFNILEKDERYFYLHLDSDAVLHLFKVISGMDSMAYGEDQIIKQVKDACFVSDENMVIGNVLNRLFQKAFETSKKVRTETGISQGGYSVSSVAVKLASKSFDNFTDCSVLLLGAGETSELVIKNFKKRGISKLYIANRTFSKAERLAAKYEGIAVQMEELNTYLTKSDILITSTSAGQYLITQSMIENITHRKELLSIIDISVPRNVENSVGEIENVELTNIDDLESIVEKCISKRKNEELEAISIVEKMALEYLKWLDSVKVNPVIEDLKMKISATNCRELVKLKNKLSDQEFEKVSDYGNYITKKITNQIITKLKEDFSGGNNGKCLEAVKLIFELG